MGTNSNPEELVQLAIQASTSSLADTARVMDRFYDRAFNFRLPTIFHPLATANSILIRRDRPLQMTVLPGGPSLALAR